MALLAVLVFICAGLYGAYLVVERGLGTDSDLEAPWSPGDRPWWKW